MSDRIVVHQSGVGLCTLLAVLFVTLKLLGQIDWSWWWVLAPLWMPIAFVCAITVVILLVAAVGAWVTSR